MKYSILKASPRMLRRNDADAYVGSRELLNRMENAGWIQPAIRQNRITLYDIKRLDECCDRLGRGEYPQAAAPELAPT